MAAMLAVGILLGTIVDKRASPPIQLQNGRMYAASRLAHALDDELASAPSVHAVRVALTFRDQSGAICRTFTQGQASGLACRDGKRWQVRGLFAAPEGQSTDYRMAGGMDPTVVNGGIINAYGTNARLGAGEWVVVEADESDGSFLRLSPTGSVDDYVQVTRIAPTMRAGPIGTCIARRPAR